MRCYAVSNDLLPSGRYMFEGDKRARLQEIGPRFTLKLKHLQLGTFDTKFGEYEWMHTVTPCCLKLNMPLT